MGDGEPDEAGWEVMAPSRGWLPASMQGVVADGEATISFSCSVFTIHHHYPYHL